MPTGPRSGRSSTIGSWQWRLQIMQGQFQQNARDRVRHHIDRRGPDDGGGLLRLRRRKQSEKKLSPATAAFCRSSLCSLMLSALAFRRRRHVDAVKTVASVRVQIIAVATTVGGPPFASSYSI